MTFRFNTELIANALHAQRMTAQELSFKLGRSSSYVSGYLSGARVPKVDTVVDMLRALNYSEEDIDNMKLRDLYHFPERRSE